MRFINLLSILIAPSLFAVDYTPWFPPPFEFQGTCAYLHERVEKVSTPEGSFQAQSKNDSLHLGLGVTPWPHWNVETELFLSSSAHIPFSYEAASLTLRYAWLDDIQGDLISLVTGLTFSFPPERYLDDFNYAYHGKVNSEFHATLGKEWACGSDWFSRIWILGGYGVASRGNGWLHGIGALEFKPISCLSIGVFTDALRGLGNQNIIPNVPFRGYAKVDHRNVDVGGFVQLDLPYLGTLSLYGWYNVYARNFIESYWGTEARLLFPFSLL